MEEGENVGERNPQISMVSNWRKSVARGRKKGKKSQTALNSKECGTHIKIEEEEFMETKI